MTNASALRSLLGVTPHDSDKFAAQLNKGIASIEQNKPDGVYNATTAALALSGDSTTLFMALGEITSHTLIHSPSLLPEMHEAVESFKGDEQLTELARHFVDVCVTNHGGPTTTYTSKEQGLGYDLEVHDNTHNAPEEGHPALQRGVLNIKKLERCLWNARHNPTPPAETIEVKAAAPKFWKPRNSLERELAFL